MAVPAEVKVGWGSIASRIGDLKSDRVAAVLEQQILTGSLAPGTVLPTEPELRELLGVSRTVIRDAVRTLTARGLLTVRQGRGTVVAEPTDDAFSEAMVALLARSKVTMRDVMHARETIEAMIAGLAATAATAEDWRDLERTYEDLRTAVLNGESDRANRAHVAFHAGILRAAHQPVLALMLTPMSELAALTGVASIRRGSMEDWEVEAHRPIIDALKARDPEAAERAIRSHFEISTRPSTYERFLDQPFSQAYFCDATSA
ncbi:putative Pyruvate dehydrogenase complex repressor [Nostocoides japonicum T1-X7]|uniref:Putative Pyruvate dehydrogenase complex repressor n=1 Tax=Nostocoides japonicum T1-X7 TaxID=1194083 RepID=A0A077LZ02_9MICO|nr:FadR/GntR family transcriptional regulator [Tetrasphaera japonica]CCH79138.1 putative Pyruvate dehydrogenase complex repressor [Tetrasphaera japonica T1-X7]